MSFACESMATRSLRTIPLGGGGGGGGGGEATQRD